MINKRNLWFLTLFSLILVLSVYYVTMPSELLMTTNSNYTSEEEPVVNTIDVSESNILTALRVEEEEKVSNELSELQAILVNADASTDDKNNAYEKIKDINNKRTMEQNLENIIQNTYNLKSFIKIDGDQIRVVALSSTHDSTLANNIIRTIQSNYDSNKYISVKFQ